MRQDKTFARILLICSIANVAIAAPAAVRQRHLDVAKAASEKRSPGSSDGETGDLPLDSSSGIPPHDSPPEDWAWFHRLSSKPDVPESSSAVANPVGTQPSGEPGLGDGAAGGSLPESSPPPANRITTQASGATASSSSTEWTSPPSHWAPSSSSDSAHRGEQDHLLPHLDFAPVRDSLVDKMLVLGGGITLFGGSVALAYGIHKWLNHPKSRRDHQVPSRMSSAVVQARTHDPKQNLVSRGLANLRDKDLRLLSVLTRRALESLV